MSISLLQLWAPILLGGFLAWIASALIHVVIQFHNKDYNQLANENEVSDALGKGSPTPGIYSMPFCTDMKEMGNPEMQKKFNDGPVAMIAVFNNGMPPMPKLMVQQILYFVVGAFLIGYCATLALAPGADYMTVFRVIASIGFLAFGWANIPFSIWYGHTWGVTARYMVDALVYALIIAGCFAWLWPSIT